MGWPSTPDPVWYDQSSFPVSASNASNSPVSAPVKTSPPLVESVAPQRGRSAGVIHFALPVIGSIALSAAGGCCSLGRSASTGGPSSTPNHSSPAFQGCADGIV